MQGNEELVDLPAVKLRQLIGRREISPRSLMDGCIARIERVDPYVNAIAATCFDQARAQARVAEQAVVAGGPLGLLHGLPLGIKDLEATAGLLTTYGSPLFRNHVPQQDDLLVARLKSAGGLVLAKTNVPEMGAGANTRNPVWGATGNPFDPRLNAGGSSGGSAAALACGMLPICTGSDTGGSLRIPAALCGVVGFRPSPGVVPSSRRMLGWTPLSVVGPMGRTVADAALQLAATAGMSASDPLSYPLDPLLFLDLPQIDLGSLRVAWTDDFGACDIEPGIRATFRQRVAAISHHFAACDEVLLSLGEVHRCFDVLRAESFVASMRESYERDPASLGPNPRANYEMGAAMSLADAAWAQAEQTRILRRFQALYRDYDILLAPTTPMSPFAWTDLHAAQIDGRQQENYYRWLALTYVSTLTTHPAISLPCGVDNRGMPFGLQVVGGFRQDHQLLGVAQSLEEVFEKQAALRRPIPDLTTLGPVQPALKSIVTAVPGSANGGATLGQVSAV